MSFAEALTAEDASPEMGELRRALHRAQRQLAASKSRGTEYVEALYQAAYDARLALGTPPAVAPPKKDKRKGGEEVALLHVSDWQVGKRNTSFDTDVAAERVDALAAKVEELTTLVRAARPVRTCVVMVGGDMIEGAMIFPGQVWEIDSSVYGQMFATVRMLEALMRRLLTTFEFVEVWDEAGNHGRVAKDSPDNFDRMVYRITMDALKGEKRLTWHHSTDWHSIVEIGEYRAMLFHGDEIKSFGGNLPAYGILRKCNAWASGVVEPFVDAYCGHFHTPMTLVLANGGSVFVNGTLESGNEYAREFVAATGRPCQRLNFVNPRRGQVTSEYRIWL